MSKIMLVEDDNNLREIYEARLLAEGYDIVSAKDGEEALALAVKEKPDLIITDVMMPKISGFDMLDILRSTPETKSSSTTSSSSLSCSSRSLDCGILPGLLLLFPSCLLDVAFGGSVSTKPASVSGVTGERVLGTGNAPDAARWLSDGTS